MPKETSTTEPIPIDDDPEQSLASTDDRWFAYKQACRAAGTEPMSWGAWMQAGQPVPA